jgi:transposase
MKSLHSRFMEENPDFKCCVKSIHTWVRQIGFKFKKKRQSKVPHGETLYSNKKKTFSETILTS